MNLSRISNKFHHFCIAISEQTLTYDLPESGFLSLYSILSLCWVCLCKIFVFENSSLNWNIYYDFEVINKRSKKATKMCHKHVLLIESRIRDRRRSWMHYHPYPINHHTPIIPKLHPKQTSQSNKGAYQRTFSSSGKEKATASIQW